MGRGGPRARRTPDERLAAWLVTGPLGHLYGFFADVAALWTRWVLAEARGRLERARAAARPRPDRSGLAVGAAPPAKPGPAAEGRR